MRNYIIIIIIIMMSVTKKAYISVTKTSQFFIIIALN